MNNFFIAIFVLCNVFIGNAYASNVTDTSDDSTTEFNKNFADVSNTVRSGLSNVTSMGKSFAATIGIGEKEKQLYSYRVYNHTMTPIALAQKKIKTIMGARLTKDFFKKMTIGPMENSGAELFNQELPFIIYVSTTEGGTDYKAIESSVFYKKNLAFNTIPNDSQTTVYNVFTYQGKIAGEKIGYAAETPFFLGQFYNTTADAIKLEFYYKEKRYVPYIEPDSFALLHALNEKNAIRPHGNKKAFFTFLQEKNEKPFARMPINPFGVAHVKNTGTDKDPVWSPDTPYLYAYTISTDVQNNNHVALEGFTIGNYTQPIKKTRDITPVECALWVQSAEQAKKEQPEEPFFDTTDSLWIAYITHDYTIMQRCVAGRVEAFTLLRPQIQEKGALLYVVALNTQNDALAKEFLKKLPAIPLNIKSELDVKEVQQLTPDQSGIITDEKLNIQAHVLLIDYFTPHGVGAGPFYYMIKPPKLKVDQFAQGILFNKKYYKKNAAGALELDGTIMQELTEKLQNWLKQYPRNKNSVSVQVREYFEQYTQDNLLTDDGLTPIGAQLAQSLITGPISIEHPPMLYNAGTNFFVFKFFEKPEGWPEK